VFLLCWGLSPGEASSAAASAEAGQQRAKYETRAIQDIREGDAVLARNENGRALGLKDVVETYVRTSDHLRILTFESEDGTRQTLKTTDEHPFWVVNQAEFVEAEKLCVGDQCAGPHGELQRLLSTVYESHPEGITVYNFQVEDYHTYFVREFPSAGTPVLVHNATYYHYTHEPVEKFKKGLIPQSHVTDTPYLTPLEAKNRLGLGEIPDKVIPVRDPYKKRFKPVQGSDALEPDLTNDELVPAGLLGEPMDLPVPRPGG